MPKYPEKPDCLRSGFFCFSAVLQEPSFASMLRRAFSNRFHGALKALHGVEVKLDFFGFGHQCRLGG